LGVTSTRNRAWPARLLDRVRAQETEPDDETETEGDEQVLARAGIFQVCRDGHIRSTSICGAPNFRRRTILAQGGTG